MSIGPHASDESRSLRLRHVVDRPHIKTKARIALVDQLDIMAMDMLTRVDIASRPGNDSNLRIGPPRTIRCAPTL